MIRSDVYRSSLKTLRSVSKLPCVNRTSNSYGELLRCSVRSCMKLVCSQIPGCICYIPGGWRLFHAFCIELTAVATRAIGKNSVVHHYELDDTLLLYAIGI